MLCWELYNISNYIKFFWFLCRQGIGNDNNRFGRPGRSSSPQLSFGHLVIWPICWHALCRFGYTIIEYMLYIYIYIYLFIYIFIYLCIHLFTFSFIHLFMYSFIYLCIHLFIYSLIYLFICWFIYLYWYSYIPYIHIYIYAYIYIYIHMTIMHPSSVLPQWRLVIHSARPCDSPCMI